VPNELGVADHAAPTNITDGSTVEPKVSAATAGGASSAVAVTFLLWVLSAYVFHGDVPLPVQGAVGLIVTTAGTFAAGYMARHVDRIPPA
jgi:hypothetical protein